ncbi:MAG: type I-C CRISPR-associated protein Cas7/Csd2 [Terracidiphilus sp.]|nr:type I-C CRISPR-associated protein Cas7/Csd2 [Terracidiphilus sp.]
MSSVENRFDFMFVFDCQDGNPNGDPDSDNSPRIDPENLCGLVSDVCTKRKVRDYVVQAVAAGVIPMDGNRLYVESAATLELQQGEAYKALGIGWKDVKSNKEDIPKATDWMCANFFDVRTFGAVMSTDKYNCGQVRGPLQITFARSQDPILDIDHRIQRVAYTKEEKTRDSKGGSEIGRKHTIPYGLYVAHGFVNPFFAQKTGFTLDDLELVRRALANLFDLDRSAARGKMAVRALPIFRHDCKLGNAQAELLFESVTIAKKEDVASPRAFADYAITLPDAASLPPGITLIDGLRQSLL